MDTGEWVVIIVADFQARRPEEILSGNSLEGRRMQTLEKAAKRLATGGKWQFSAIQGLAIQGLINY